MSEVLRELVVALSLDSDNFSRNLRTINQQIKEAESTFRLAGAGVTGFEKSLQGTEAKLTLLSSKQKEQTRAVDQYSRALIQANQKLTDSHTRQVKMQSALVDAKAEYGLKIMGCLTSVYPFSMRVICGKCNKCVTMRTWYRNGKPLKVWQCSSKYAQKGVPCCGNGNLKDKKLWELFSLAWKRLLDTREERVPGWEKRMREGNELEALRAEQMIKVSESWDPRKAPDTLLVNMVLDHLIFLPDQVTFYFKDSSEVII